METNKFSSLKPKADVSEVSAVKLKGGERKKVNVPNACLPTADKKTPRIRTPEPLPQKIPVMKSESAVKNTDSEKQEQTIKKDIKSETAPIIKAPIINDKTKKSEIKEKKAPKEKKVKIQKPIKAPKEKKVKAPKIKKTDKGKKRENNPELGNGIEGFFKGLLGFFRFFERPKVFTTMCVILAAVSLFVIISAVFMVRPNLGMKDIPSEVTVMYNFYGSTQSGNTSGNNIFLVDSDTVYVNFTEISRKIPIMMIGDENEIRFYKDDGTYLTVRDNSPYVNISGVDIVLSSPVIFKGESVYVPADLLDNYTSGISVDYNVYRERLTISTAENEKLSNAVNKVYDEFQFLPMLPQGLKPIPEPEM